VEAFVIRSQSMTRSSQVNV